MDKKIKNLGVFFAISIAVVILIQIYNFKLYTYFKNSLEIIYFILGGLGLFMIGIKQIDVSTKKEACLKLKVIQEDDRNNNCSYLFLKIYNDGNALAENVMLESQLFNGSSINKNNLGYIEPNEDIKIQIGVMFSKIEAFDAESGGTVYCNSKLLYAFGKKYYANNMINSPIDIRVDFDIKDNQHKTEMKSLDLKYLSCMKKGFFIKNSDN